MKGKISGKGATAPITHLYDVSLPDNVSSSQSMLSLAKVVAGCYLPMGFHLLMSFSEGTETVLASSSWE